MKKNLILKTISLLLLIVLNSVEAQEKVNIPKVDALNLNAYNKPKLQDQIVLLESKGYKKVDYKKPNEIVRHVAYNFFDKDFKTDFRYIIYYNKASEINKMDLELTVAPEKWVNYTAAQKREEFFLLYDNLIGMISKEMLNPDFNTGLCWPPYTVQDLGNPEKYLQGVKEGKIIYSAHWSKDPSTFDIVHFVEVFQTGINTIRISVNAIEESKKAYAEAKAGN